MDKNDAPKTAEAVMKELRDTRVHPEAACKNCIHAYPFKIDLRTNGLECRADPPTMAFAVIGDSAGRPAGVAPLNIIPRVVPENYFCSRFADASLME